MNQEELRKAAERLVSVHFDEPATEQDWSDILLGMSMDRSDVAKSVRAALLVAANALPKLLADNEALRALCGKLAEAMHAVNRDINSLCLSDEVCQRMVTVLSTTAQEAAEEWRAMRARVAELEAQHRDLCQLVFTATDAELRGALTAALAACQMRTHEVADASASSGGRRVMVCEENEWVGAFCPHCTANISMALHDAWAVGYPMGFELPCPSCGKPLKVEVRVAIMFGCCPQAAGEGSRPPGHWTGEVLLVKAVRSDMPIGPRLAAAPGWHHAETNRHGAVSVRIGGKWLGIKPGEYDDWRPQGEGEGEEAPDALAE